MRSRHRMLSVLPAPGSLGSLAPLQNPAAKGSTHARTDTSPLRPRMLACTRAPCRRPTRCARASSCLFLLTAAASGGGHKSTGSGRRLVARHRRRQLELLAGRCLVRRSAAVAGWSHRGMVDRVAPAAGGLAVWALLASNLASLALLFHHYVSRPRLPVLARSADSNGATQQPSPPPQEEDEKETDTTPAEPPLAPDAVINLELGDPTMYEAFWREAGERAAVVIPGWWGLSYSSDTGAVCWFLEPELDREVRRLHRLVGNAAVDGYHLVVGTGATQLYQAAMYALSSAADNADHPVAVVSPAPYYSSYPPQTDLLLSGLYRWAGDANAFAGGRPHIELVCSPNNPDGAIREAVLSPDAGKPIHDLVYYWPQYTPISEPAARHDVMLFTASKATGHAGSRLGWALVRDAGVAKKMVYFVDRSTIGVSKDSQLRVAKILAVVSDAYDDDAQLTGGPRLFDFARRRMAERWRALRAAVAASGAFSLPEETSGYCSFTKQTAAAYPAFAWLRCEKEGVDDCAELLAEHRIVARGGRQFGGDARCVRVNMLDRDRVFDTLVWRLSTMFSTIT